VVRNKAKEKKSFKFFWMVPIFCFVFVCEKHKRGVTICFPICFPEKKEKREKP